MIAASRAYIVQQIQKCNSDYSEIKDVFNDDQLALSEVTNGFKIAYGPLSSEYNGNYFTDTVPVSLEIYKRASQTQEISDHDTLYDLAIDIKNTILDPLFVKTSVEFSDIIWGDITPEPLPSNDRVFKLILTFSVRKDLAFQGV